jgi:hypothetical protein
MQKDKANTSLKWRIGMLYICGESVQDIANWIEIPRERVKMVLNALVMGVE